MIEKFISVILAVVLLSIANGVLGQSVKSTSWFVETSYQSMPDKPAELLAKNLQHLLTATV